MRACFDSSSLPSQASPRQMSHVNIALQGAEDVERQRKRAQHLRTRTDRFRVLIIGRANAGKTTILQRVCNTTEQPKVFNQKGHEVSHVLDIIIYHYWHGQIDFSKLNPTTQVTWILVMWRPSLAWKLWLWPGFQELGLDKSQARALSPSQPKPHPARAQAAACTQKKIHSETRPEYDATTVRYQFRHHSSDIEYLPAPFIISK